MRHWPTIGVALAWYWTGKPPIVELSRPWFRPGDTAEVIGTKFKFLRAHLRREYLILRIEVDGGPATLPVPRDGRMRRAYGVAWKIA